MSADFFDARVIEILDTVVERVRGLGVEPIFLGECPNKFNDANHDDLWYAVQAGRSVWEQSHFFNNDSGAFVREGTRFTVPDSKDALIEAGADVTSEQVGFLRGELRFLQKSGWRDLLRWQSLAALVIERDQKWLVLERPNAEDGRVLSWDENGFFQVGLVDRIDQAVGKSPVLEFVEVRGADIHRLSVKAREYFSPTIKDPAASARLAELLWSVAEATRRSTEFAVSFVPKRPGFPPGRSAPQCFCPLLQPNEGMLSRPQNGVWPKFRPSFGRPVTREPSELAKSLVSCLAKLEDADWSKLSLEVFGTRDRGARSILFVVGPEFAVLILDTAVFRVLPDSLEIFGQIGLPYEGYPDQIVETCLDLMDTP